MSDANILREVKEYPKDHFHSCTHDTKHFRMMETNWKVKAMITHALELGMQQPQYIKKQIRIFEGNSEAFYILVFRSTYW